CTNIPYDFHPMYSTSSEKTRVTWAAHSYNIAFSDEIGHFEYCATVTVDGGCSAGTSSVDPTGDADDPPCFGPATSTRIQIGGCLGTDTDFDGVPYQNVWPGTSRSRSQDLRLHPSP